MFCIELSLKQFSFFLGFVCQKYVDSQNTKLKARGLHMGLSFICNSFIEPGFKEPVC